MADQFRMVYGEYIIPKQPIVQMQSRTPIGHPIYVIHPLDGTVSTLITFAKAFDRPVWGLQCTLEAPSEKCNDLAEFYIKKIKSVQGKGPYTVVGYSYGGLIGFEVAVRLQASGETVQLFLIDSSPFFIKYYTQSVIDRKGLVKIAEDANDQFDIALAFFTCKMNSKVPNPTEVILKYLFTN